MSIRRRNPEDAAAPLVFYHGAQRWEGPPSIVAHRKGHAEHGAGIYLTTSWERAASYAKGGGSVYRFEVSPDMRWLEDARLPAAETVRWVKSLPRLKGKADIVASLERTAGRVGPSIPAEGLVAAFVNFGASAGQHGPSLAEYLVAHGIDASHVQPTVNEDWVVVFNPAKVLRVTRLAAKDTGAGFVYDLPRVRRNPEDGPTRIRLSGFSTVRKMRPEVEAFLRDLYEASYPNVLSSDPSSRILANAKARVEVTPMHGGVHIDELEAGSRGQGAGTEALRFLTGLADKHGISLFLQAHPFGDERMSLEALERFYRRHGFRPDDEEDNDDEATHMHRWPRQTNPRQTNPRQTNPRLQNPARKVKPPTLAEAGLPSVWFHGTQKTFGKLKAQGGACIWLADKAGAMAYATPSYGRRSAIRLIEVLLSPDTRVVDLANTSDPVVRSFIHLDASVSNMRWHGREDVTDAEMADAVTRWQRQKTDYDAIEARPWAKAFFRKAGADALLVRDVAGWGGYEAMPSLCLLNAKKTMSERDVAPDLSLVRAEDMPKHANPLPRAARRKVTR